MSYNGWTNYETWNVALWIDNDESTYRARVERFEREPITAGNVRRFVEKIFPYGTRDMRGAGTDFESGRAAMSRVNWQEIADNWRDE